MKMQEKEWFAARAPAIAHQKRDADRKRMILKLISDGDPLAKEYEIATHRVEAAMGCARRSGDYPLLSHGDINIYSLFVERAQALLKPDGIAGLLTPSGILSDKMAERFLKVVVPSGRIMFGLDFFNRRLDGSRFFPDVYYRYKFCAFICGRKMRGDGVGRYMFFARSIEDVAPERLIAIDEAMINELSPTSFLIPVLRNERDFEISTLLANASAAARFKEQSIFRYRRAFDMAGDSGLFVTIEELNALGAYVTEDGNWRQGGTTFERVFEGKMIQAFDHRAASIGFYAENTFRTGSSETTTSELYQDPAFLAVSRFYLSNNDLRWNSSRQWALAIKDVTSTTNTRSIIAALVPRCAAGHTMPLLFERDGSSGIASVTACANLNAYALDFFARQKIHNNHLTLNIIDQLPLITREGYERHFGKVTASELVRSSVLRLTYTANDMRHFARDMESDDVPFSWDENERRHLCARLDALYFCLYGVTDEADIRYVLSTFPIVERKDRKANKGTYLTAELIIWYHRALINGDTSSIAPQSTILRTASKSA